MQKHVVIKERELTDCQYKNHLKWSVVSNGVIVGEHSEIWIAEMHKEKILTPIKPPQYKGKSLI